MVTSNNYQQQDFCFTVRLDFPNGFDENLLTADSSRWLIATVPQEGYSSKRINVPYSGWRHPAAERNLIFDNMDRLSFVHGHDTNCILLWGTRRSTNSLHSANVFGLGSTFRLALEKALLFYSTRIYHGAFTITQIDYRTPVNLSLGDQFAETATLSADQLNQPFAHRDAELTLADGVPHSRDFFSNNVRFQQSLLVALKNFVGATSSDKPPPLRYFLALSQHDLLDDFSAAHDRRKPR